MSKRRSMSTTVLFRTTLLFRLRFFELAFSHFAPLKGHIVRSLEWTHLQNFKNTLNDPKQFKKLRVRCVSRSTLCSITGKNNGFPFLDILGYLKNTHKNPNFGKVRQVPTREFPTKFPVWDLSHSSKFGIFMGIHLIP